MEKGLIQVYCGNGKGKTTAAIGQGIRAIGYNNKVIMIQFLKTSHSGELETLKKLEPNFKLFRFEKKRNFFWNLTDEEKEELKIEINLALNFAKKVLDTKQCDILILDEILGVIQNKLIDEEEILNLLDTRPESMEIILTGRVVSDSVKERAHYVSCIDDAKHPFNQGIGSREGIEF